MEKIINVIFTFAVLLGLTLVLLGIIYNHRPKTEKQEPTETTVIELHKVE